jgi:hypothetical protein
LAIFELNSFFAFYLLNFYGTFFAQFAQVLGEKADSFNWQQADWFYLTEQSSNKARNQRINRIKP